MMKLLEQIRDQAHISGNRIAYQEMQSGERTLTYARLWSEIERVAARLVHDGLSRQTVMLLLPNCLEFPVAFLGALAAGCNVFPISPETPDVELHSLGKASNITVLIGSVRVFSRQIGSISRFIDVTGLLNQQATSADLPAESGELLLCSSGTTGRSKIAVRDAKSLDAVAANTANAVGFNFKDRVLSLLPLCHSYGLEHGLLAPLWAGSTIHLATGLDFANLLQQLNERQISIFPSVPSVYEMLCQRSNPVKLPHLKQAYAAGAPLPVSIFDGMLDKFGVTVGQLYGATEIGSVTFNNPLQEHFDLRSVGRPFAGVKIRIIDPNTNSEQPVGIEGEILIAAPSMFRGYLHDSAPGLRDGYFATGDLGRIDDFGNLTITGRLKELIDVGGLKVNVLEVEDVLRAHPSVEAAAVVGIQLSETISRLKAFVTSRDAGRPPIVEELREFLRERLAPHKVPRVIEVRPSLPRSATGKILRKALEDS